MNVGTQAGVTASSQRNVGTQPGVSGLTQRLLSPVDDVPGEDFVVMTLPAMHVTVRHTLELNGTSRSSMSLRVLPEPSQTTLWQSGEADCIVVAVNSGWLAMPHTPCRQVRAWQSVSSPGQVLAFRHSTQEPAPSHI